MTHFPTKTAGKIFGKLVSPTAEKKAENYDLLYQNSIRKYEVLEH